MSQMTEPMVLPRALLRGVDEAQPARRVPGALTLLGIGLRRVLGRPGLVLAAWLQAAGPAVLLSLPLLGALGAALSDRPAAQALSRGEADVLFSELLADQAGLTPAAGMGALAALLLSWLLWLWLSGGFTDALRRPGDPRRVIGGGVLARAAQTGPAMIGIGLWGLLLRAPVALLLGGGVALLGEWLRGRALSHGLWAFGALLTVCGLLWTLGSIVLHLARVRRLQDQGTRPWAALLAIGYGLRVVRRGAGRVLVLAVCNGLVLLLLVWLGRHVSQILAHGRGGAGGQLLWQQLIALGHAAWSLAVLAATIEVQVQLDPLRPPGRP